MKQPSVKLLVYSHGSPVRQPKEWLPVGVNPIQFIFLGLSIASSDGCNGSGGCRLVRTKYLQLLKSFF